MSEEFAPDFKFNPDRGAWLASFGPKGSGKSELSTRLLRSFPYDAMLIDHTGDVDPHHDFTEPLTAELARLAVSLRDADGSDASTEGLAVQVREAWRHDGQRHKYRYIPNYLERGWLETTDLAIGLAYLLGQCCIHLDEVNDACPVGQTPRWTRLDLRMGRHRKLSNLMPGPRPSDLDPLVLNQADVVTIHGQLHELDVRRLAKHLHLRERELLALIESLQRFERDGVEVGEFLAYFKKDRELVIYPPLPPRARS